MTQKEPLVFPTLSMMIAWRRVLHYPTEFASHEKDGSGNLLNFILSSRKRSQQKEAIIK